MERDRVVEDGADRHADGDVGDPARRAGVPEDLVEHEVVRLAEGRDDEQRDGVDVADGARNDHRAAQVRRRADQVAPGVPQRGPQQDREAEVGSQRPPLAEDRGVDRLGDLHKCDGREQEVEADLGHGLAHRLGDDALFCCEFFSEFFLCVRGRGRGRAR